MGSGTYDRLHGEIRKLVFKQGMDLETAAAQVLREYELHGPAPTMAQNAAQRQPRVAVPNPTGRQLQRTLTEILPPIQNAAQRMGKTYRNTLSRRQMERRYQYSKRCRDVMMKIVKEDIQRDQKFLDTAKRLFGDNPYDRKVEKGAQPPKVDKRRWLEQLMRLDNSEEARYHNEEVVSLVMLGEYSGKYGDPDAGKRKFREARYNHYINDLKQTEEEANRNADADLRKGTRRLAELTLDMIRRQRSKPEEADQALDAILTGTAERNGVDGLERAYRTLFNPGNTVTWNLRNAHSDLNSFGAGISDDEYQQVYRPYEMSSVSPQGEIAGLVVNPYYAVLDGSKLSDAGVMELPSRRGEDSQSSPFVAFGIEAATGFPAVQLDHLTRNLTRFNFTEGNETQLRQQPEYVSVYSSGNRSLILVGKPRNPEQGLGTLLVSDKPGRLINGNFAKMVSDMKEAVEKKDQVGRSSPEYRAMKRALNNVSKVKIPDNGDPAKLNELEQKLEALKTAADAYIAKKNREFAERGAPEGQNGKNPYERQRYLAATSMGGFIDEMNTRIRHIRQHQNTVAVVIEEERLVAMQAQQNEQLQNERQDAQQQDVPPHVEDVPPVEQQMAQDDEEEEIRLDPPKEVRVKREEYEQGKKKGPGKQDKKEDDQKQKIGEEDRKDDKKKVEEKVKEQEENPNRINEAKPKPDPIDPDEKNLICQGMDHLISEAYYQLGFEKWVEKDYAPGKFDASNAFLNNLIDTYAMDYLKVSPGNKYSAKEALSYSVIKYMLNHAEHGQVLDFALEYGQSSALYTEINMSKSFKDQLAQVDWDNLAEGEACLKDENRVIKPLGDKLLCMMEDVLEKEAPKVAKEKLHRAYTWAETRANNRLERSEKALEQGNTEEAARLGIDAIALQTVSGLVKSTAGMAGNPFALQKMVRKSEYFKTEIEKFDFSQPGALRKAIDAKVGAKIADTFLEKRKQKSSPVENNQPLVKSEQDKQQKAAKQNAK